MPLDFGFDGVRGVSCIVAFLEDVGVPLDFGFDGVRGGSMHCRLLGRCGRALGLWF